MKNKIIKRKNKLPIIELDKIDVLKQLEEQQKKSIQVGFFNIPIPDWTDEYNIERINRSDNYYERLDFEFITWDSTVKCVAYDKTLEGLLEKIWDKYDLSHLSWIIRKSIIQIQNKLQKMGLQKYLTEKEKKKEIVKKLTGKVERTDNKFIITIHQTENREMEKWLVENNSFRQFDPEKVKVQLFDIPESVEAYIKDDDFENAFKLMVCFCNLFKIAFIVKIAEESMTDFDAHFILSLNQIQDFVKYLGKQKLLKKKECKEFENKMLLFNGGIK
jgi:hypothetical protein